MIRLRPFLLGLLALGCARTANVASPASPAMALSPTNPFFSASALPYQAPPFDRIRDADYQPAIEAGMRDQIAEVDSIANATSDPTFENTIVPMERSGALLTRASKVFFALTSANTDDTIQKTQAALAPKLAAHYDAIFLNDKLYRRVHAIYDKRDALNLAPEQHRLVEHYERDFVRAGIRLSETDKARVRALNQEEGKLTTDFQTKLLAATKAGAVVVSDSTQLAGLSSADLAAAAAAAKDRGLTGKWVLPLQNTTQQPAQASLTDRTLREQLFAASTQRAEHSDSNDTRGFRVAPWDWQFYAERVRQANYNLDESQLKPYFELDRVLHDGVFFAARQLYGLTFKERKDIPVYHPDVRVFEVFDANGTPLALFYTDYFQRPSKSGGAWMDVFVDQNGLTGTKPVVYNVANFQKPSAGQPALLSFGDVTTMFHEFGHALHGMLSRVKHPTLAGTNVPRDFVEFPSQFNEHWASDPAVFANYAKHYQTGEPMPQSLVEKIRRAHTFNQGYDTTDYLSA